MTARAIKRVIARQLDTLMQDHGLTKSSLAKRMKTSRAQLDRLLDPDNESVTLGTLTRVARPSDGIRAWSLFKKTQAIDARLFEAQPGSTGGARLPANLQES